MMQSVFFFIHVCLQLWMFVDTYGFRIAVSFGYGRIFEVDVVLNEIKMHNICFLFLQLVQKPTHDLFYLKLQP